MSVDHDSSLAAKYTFHEVMNTLDTENRLFKDFSKETLTSGHICVHQGHI